MKRFFLLLSFVVTYFNTGVLAQDTLFIVKDEVSLSQDEIMVVDVIELGIDNIKYRPIDDPDSPIIVIEKSKVDKVVTKNGKVYVFNDGFNDAEIYKMQRKNAIKFGLFSPLFTTLQFGYERSIKPGQSIDGTLGIIGIGADPSELNPGGAYLKIGYKFISTPDYYIKGMRYSHLLKGWYAKPEIIISVFSREKYYYYNFNESISRETIVAGAVVMNIGKQWVFSDSFLIDFFLGAGFGFANNGGDFDYFYGFMGAANGFPVALSGGFKIGFLLR